MDRTKILMVIPSLEGGGAERVMVNIINHLDRERFELSLYVERLEGKYVEDLRDDVQVVCAGNRRGLSRLFFLRNQIRQIKPDVVFIMMLPIAVIAARLAFVGTIPVVRETQSLPISHVRQGLIPRFLNWLGMKTAYRLVAPAEAAKRYLQKRYGLDEKRIAVINNPVNINEIQQAVSDPLSFTSGVVHLVAIGRLKYQKGFDLLLQALAPIDQFKWKLRILGNGPLEEELKDQASAYGIGEQVEFMGFQENPYAIMRASDLFILSSRWEGLPNVVLEAMAVGVAVLATRCPTGPEEIITPGVNGELCDISVDSLTANIKEIGLSSSVRKTLVEGGHKRILDFDLPSIIDRYETFFLDCHKKEGADCLS